MDAIISFNHFCELHGPRILLSTQSFPYSIETFEVHSSNISHGLSDDCQSQNKSSTASMRTLCEGCRSFGKTESGYISVDEKKSSIFVSRQYPSDQDVFSIVRQACVRSLSCEVCPGREGPILFGDDVKGYALSYSFYVKDAQARGFQRFYSIIVIMMDQLYLMHSWPFFVSSIRRIVEKIQTKASFVFESEQSASHQRDARLRANFAHRSARISSDRFFRSIRTLTKDQNIFQYVHQCYSWMLKYGGSRLIETLRQAPPLEDDLVLMETQEKDLERSSMPSLDDVCGDMSGPQDLSDSSCLESFANPTLRHTRNVNQLSTLVQTPKFSSVSLIFRTLGVKKFIIIGHHLYIGNQVVVRGEQEGIVASFIRHLADLIPIGCQKQCQWSNSYKEAWECNLLGLPSHVTIPVSVEEAYVLLEIIGPPEDIPPIIKKQQHGNQFMGYCFAVSSPVILPKLETPSILLAVVETLQQIAELKETQTLSADENGDNPKVHPTKAKKKLDFDNPLTPQEGAPKLDRTMDFPADPASPVKPGVVDEDPKEYCFYMLLQCIRETWLNKSKLLYNFTKTSRRKDDELQNLFKTLGCKTASDDVALRFFMTGLSKQYKQQILSIASLKSRVNLKP